MKTLQRICATLMLTLALAFSSFAGDMSTSVVAPPPPASQTTTTGDISTSATGQIEIGITGEMTTGVTATDSTTTEIVLNLVQSLLALF